MRSTTMTRMAPTASAAATALRRATTLTALHEVDDERHPVEGVAGPQPVLEEVGVLARDPLARVDLDGEARRVGLDLRDIEQLQAVALLGRRLAGPPDLAEGAGWGRGRGAPLHAGAEGGSPPQHAPDVAA